MRLGDINIRDPFVLVHNNIYYLYGTNCGICDAYEKDSENGELLCVWSSFCKDGYCELVSRSDNGDIDGNWTVDREPIFGKNGGHGMIFDTIDGERMFVMHTPNDPPYERVALYEVNDTGNSIKISKKEPV